jgi:RNA polymerase sigma-70 factor (ECF subfamily)
LWENNRRWVAAVLLAHKPASADVDDLLQEVAVALVAKISTLGEPANFQPWLRVVALNVARLAGRKFAAGPRMVRGADLSGGPDGEGGGGPLALRASGEAGPSTGGGRSQVSEEAQRLMALARELPEEYREPLLLRCVQELSYQKISAILGLPETTIETRIARGRRMLRERAVAAAAVGAGKVGGRMAASPGYPA